MTHVPPAGRGFPAVVVLLTMLVSGAVISCAARSTPAPTPTSAAAQPATPRTQFTTICATCHGQRGEGNIQLKTPSIAGLPAWYVTMQLEKFRAHQRGSDPQDVSGKLMHAIAQSVKPEDIAQIAEIVASLSPLPTRNTLGGDAVRGGAIYRDGCIDCHRYNGSGEQAFRSAPLTGLQDWYLAAQLGKFRDGIRGVVRADEDGAKMHLVTSGMTDEQFLSVVAYIAELAAKR